MPCLNPMIAIRTGHFTKNNKPEYRFLSSLKKYYLSYDEEIIRNRGSFPVFVDQNLYPVDESVYVYDVSTGEVVDNPSFQDAVILPCGQCIGCRMQYAASWANRIMLEAQYHEKSYFITLTYDEEHVPTETAEDGSTVLTLQPKDFQDFLKRLRDQQDYHHGNKIRFYGVGEYGSKFHRPHYHVIIFGLILDDIVDHGKNANGTLLHDSPTINRLWGKGITEVSELNWQNSAYCARYTVKKLGKKETDFYEKNHLVPEFSRMSLKPAIGAKYFDEHMEDIYKYDRVSIPLANGSRTVKPPRYYDDKYDDIYPADFAQVKQNRKEIASEQLKLKLDNFSGTYLELLYNQEQEFRNRVKSLRRNLE